MHRKPPSQASSDPGTKTPAQLSAESEATRYIALLKQYDKAIEKSLETIAECTKLISEHNPDYKLPQSVRKQLKEFKAEMEELPELVGSLITVQEDARKYRGDFISLQSRVEARCLRYRFEIAKFGEMANEVALQAEQYRPALKAEQPSHAGKLVDSLKPPLPPRTYLLRRSLSVSQDPADELKKGLLKLNVYDLIDKIQKDRKTDQTLKADVIRGLESAILESMTSKKQLILMVDKIHSVIAGALRNKGLGKDMSVNFRIFQREGVDLIKNMQMNNVSASFNDIEAKEFQHLKDIATFYLAKAYPTKSSNGKKLEDNSKRLLVMVPMILKSENPEALSVMIEKIKKYSETQKVVDLEKLKHGLTEVSDKLQSQQRVASDAGKRSESLPALVSSQGLLAPKKIASAPVVAGKRPDRSVPPPPATTSQTKKPSPPKVDRSIPLPKRK